jgi:hypothetical protein
MDCTHSIRDPQTRKVVVIKPYEDNTEPDKQTLEVKVWSMGPDMTESEKAPFYSAEDHQDVDEDNIMSWDKGTK